MSTGSTSTALAPDAEALFTRVRRLEVLVLGLLRHCGDARDATALAIPVRGPVRRILHADQQARLRRARRVAHLLARHARREFAHLDRDCLSRRAQRGGKRGNGGTSEADILDVEERTARMLAISAGVDRLFKGASLHAKPAEPSHGAPDTPSDVFLQNELADAGGDDAAGCDEASVGSVVHREKRALRPATTGTRHATGEPRSPGEGGGRCPRQASHSHPPDPVRRGHGTMDDPIVPMQPLVGLTSGLSPGRIPVVVIDHRAPPLFGPRVHDPWSGWRKA